jgi:hypothetical protein
VVRYLVEASYAWFVKDAQSSIDLTGITAYYAELTEQQMRAVKGGCVDYDCLPNGTNCNTVPGCYTNGNYPLAALVCDNQTAGRRCMITFNGILPCVTLPDYSCLPLQRLTGDCVNGVCSVYDRGDAQCNARVGQCRDWLW